MQELMIRVALGQTKEFKGLEFFRFLYLFIFFFLLRLVVGFSIISRRVPGRGLLTDNFTLFIYFFSIRENS